MATRVSDNVKQTILARYRDGESIRSLAKSFDRDFSTMRTNLINWGANIRCDHPHRRRYTEAERQQAVALYESGRTVDEVATVFGVRPGSMKEALHRFGAPIRRRGPSRAYGLNERYFQVVTTEAQAYWLGFMLADGNVCKGSASGSMLVQLDLGAVDREHLEQFVKAVEYTGPIQYREETNAYAARITSAAMAHDLMALECTPRKSCVHGTPKLDPTLMHHMYRGFFDGDGSLYETPTTHSWRFEVIGSRKFVEEFQQWLAVTAHVTPTKLFDCGQVVAVRSSGCRVIERIMTELYRDATIYLPRKFEQYQQMLRRSC